MAHDPDAMGALGAEQVLTRLAGEAGPPRQVVLPTRLVPRGSGEHPAWTAENACRRFACFGDVPAIRY